MNQSRDIERGDGAGRDVQTARDAGSFGHAAGLLADPVVPHVLPAARIGIWRCRSDARRDRFYADRGRCIRHASQTVKDIMAMMHVRREMHRLFRRRRHAQDAAGLIVGQQPQRTIRPLSHVTNAFVQTLEQPFLADQAVARAFKSRHQSVFQRTIK